MILALLFAVQIQASSLVEKWSAPIKDGTPVAAFFDAGSASLFVSVSAGKKARIDKYDLKGNLVTQGLVKVDGAAGPMRAHFGKVYWGVGFTIWSFDPATGKKEMIGSIPEGMGNITDLAIARNGAVYVSVQEGVLLEHTKEGTRVRNEGELITGLFLLDTDLYLLKKKHIQSLELKTEKLGPKKVFCQSECIGLEKASSGAWITAEGNKLREINGTKTETILEAKETIARFAYVYDREPKEDMLILPFPKSSMLRAYRFH